MSVHIIYNPRSPQGAEIKAHWFDYREWNLPTNELFQTEEEHVYQHLLESFQFLRSVRPNELKRFQELMKEKEFKCDECEEQFEKKSELGLHKANKHGFEPGSEKLEGIKVLSPQKMVRKGTTIKQALTPGDIESQEGIMPAGQTDRDGVTWYEDGLTQDTGSGMGVRIPGQTPGAFNAG